MNRRGTGMIFIVIGALFISTKYISASIYGSNVEAWKVETFQDQLNNMGNLLDILSLTSVLTGVIYLLLAEFKKTD